MKVKIIRLSKEDAWYDYRKLFIGSVGKCRILDGNMGRGWSGISFTPDNPPDGYKYKETFCFAYVKFEVLEE